MEMGSGEGFSGERRDLPTRYAGALARRAKNSPAILRRKSRLGAENNPENRGSAYYLVLRWVRGTGDKDNG